jgi:hypothetical protein
MTDNQAGCYIVLIVAFVVLASAAVGLTGNYFRCTNQWADYNPTWGPFEGCRIEIDGKRTPTSAIRELRP